MPEIDLKKLAAPFPAKDVEWRVARSGEKDGRPWAQVLAYITNRAVMDRLDDVCGPENWRNEFSFQPGGVLCGISVKVDGEWVTKWDGSDASDVEPFKGALSGSMKRTGVVWGIGRYLYDLDDGWAVFDPKGQYSAKIENRWHKWNPPQLPAWALPKLHAPPPADSRAANTLSPVEQDRAKQAFPQPAGNTISRATFDQIEAAGKALKFRPIKEPNSEWLRLMKDYGVHRMAALTVDQGDELLRDLLRRQVSEMLQAYDLNLSDLRVEVPAITADTPDGLTLAEAQAAVAALKAWGRREAVA